ncbi:MAG: flagellar hook capping FlgD N-terminal domain-containing protein [Phycisphaeraceae bacterium]
MSAAIGGAASVINQPNTTPGANGFANLSSGEFLQIILSELSNQDPLAPNDTAAILEQLSSIRNIETQTQLDDKLSDLVTQNSISTSANFIGKFVSGLDANNNNAQGIVESLSVRDGKPVLNLAGGAELEAERVTQVEDLGDLDTQVVQQLLANLQVLDSGSLIGRDVVGSVASIDGGTRQVSGRVTGVTVVDGQIQLELDTLETLPLGGVRSFKESQ